MTYEVLKNGKDTVHLHKFDDIADFARECKEKGVLSHQQDVFHNGTAFAGGMKISEAIKACDDGVSDDIGATDEILKKINTDGIQLTRPQWETSIAGAFPNVPAYLAGENECMFNLGCDVSETAPIKVVVGLASSAAVQESELKTRGAAILALVMKLAEFRPIELWVFDESNLVGAIDSAHEAVLIMQQINTKPLNLSVANFVLTHSAFTRGLIYSFTQKNLKAGSKFAFIDLDSDSRINRLKFAMGVTDNDIVITSTTTKDLIVIDPIKYINQTLAKVAEQTQH